MISAWRIVKRKHLRHAWTGYGARVYGGRWNSLGVAVVYAAQSPSLAALEILVHLDASEPLHFYLLLEVSFDESLVTRIQITDLPRNWKDSPPPDALAIVGNEWSASLRSAVLQVPSAVMPAEHNFLINPAHPDFARLSFSKPQAIRFDRRLVKRGA